MLLEYILGYALCLWTVVLATPQGLPIPAGGLANIRVLGNQSLNPMVMFNESVTSFNVTADNEIQIQCNGSSYGFDLDINDCEEAKAYFPASSDQVRWATRNTGWQKIIFPLPYRAMGDKALCYVQPVIINGASSAKATPNQVRNAAAKIRHECFSGGKLQGGVATNIGE